MKRIMLECVQKALTVILSVSATMGMFLMGVFVARLFVEQVSERAMWMMFLMGLVMTYVLTKILTLVKWELYNLLVDELEFQEDEKAVELYEHLKVK